MLCLSEALATACRQSFSGGARRVIMEPACRQVQLCYEAEADGKLSAQNRYLATGD